MSFHKKEKGDFRKLSTIVGESHRY